MDVEQEATQLGWTPKDQFKGNPEKWIPADEFVARGKEIMPILRKNNEKLLADVVAVKAENARLAAAITEAQESMTEFRKFHDETAQRAYEQALKDLRIQKADAIKAGDGDTVVAVDEAIQDLNSKAPKALKEDPKPTPPAQIPVHPDIAPWEKDNEAWLAEPDKKAYAMSIGGYVRAMHPKLEGRAFLDKITEEVEKHFGGGKPVQRVEGAGNNPPRRSGKSYSDLPTDARQACDRMAQKLVGPSRAFKTVDEWRASYVKSYQWE